MKAFISTVLLVASVSQGARAAPSDTSGANTRFFNVNRPVGGYNTGVTGVNTGFGGVNSGFGGVNPGFGGVNPGFGGVNPGLGGGYGAGGGSSGFSGSCRYWCRTPQGQAYCCEGGNEVASQPTVKPGQCPPVRPQCPPTRNFRPPQQCSNDSRCPGAEKCCFDTCLQHHTCKAPISIYG